MTWRVPLSREDQPQPLNINRRSELAMISKPVEIVARDGRHISGEFILWDQAPEKTDQLRLELRYAGEAIATTADTFFDALIEIREVLEEQGLRPKCLGACQNVYPSSMIRSMGCGEMAYQLKDGCQAKMKDLVSIFDVEPEIIPVSVEEQEEYYRKWLKSLK